MTQRYALIYTRRSKYVPMWIPSGPLGRRIMKRAGVFRRRYGIGLEEYFDLLVAQDYCCAICKRPTPEGQDIHSWIVDHDHTTGRVRGLLCNDCNRGMGLLQDQPDYLKAAVEYLEAAQ